MLLWVLKKHHSEVLTLPHYILEESIFNFSNVRLHDIDIPKEKWLNYLQIVEALHILWGLIWVCIVCQLPFQGSPVLNGLIITYSIGLGAKIRKVSTFFFI